MQTAPNLYVTGSKIFRRTAFFYSLPFSSVFLPFQFFSFPPRSFLAFYLSFQSLALTHFSSLPLRSSKSFFFPLIKCFRQKCFMHTLHFRFDESDSIISFFSRSSHHIACYDSIKIPFETKHFKSLDWTLQ